MKKKFLSMLAKAINTYLGLDPETKKRLQSLNGKIITIEFLPFHFVFQFVFTDQGITISADELLQAQTKIKGTPLQLLNVILIKTNRHRFFAEDLVIEGDALIGQQVVTLFDHLEIDWEEYSSHFIGDVSAHHAGRFLHKMKSWLRKTEENISQDINDYIHEEKKWLPVREALNDFFDDVDQVRMDVDRLEKRIKRLEEVL